MPKMTVDEKSPVEPSRFNFPSCSELKNQKLTEDQILEHLDSNYPAELVDTNKVEEINLNDQDLKQLSRYLACISSLTVGPDAPESALALFTSKKHGKRTFSILDQLADVPGPDGDDAKTFAARMREFAKGPSE
jgi:hypothetical protein